MSRLLPRDRFSVVLLEKAEQGFSLIEIMLALILATIVIAGMVTLLPQVINHFYRSTIRNQLQNDARNAMTTMTHFIQLGNASTTQICSCGQTACSVSCSSLPGLYPYSRIEFTVASSTPSAFAFYYWQSAAYMSVTPPGATTAQVTRLAQNVTSLTFNTNPLDPANILISLRLDKALASNQDESLLLSNQAAHMVTTL